MINNPFSHFTDWYHEAIKRKVHEPTAMVLATSTPQGAPSARVILLKGHDERGFCFFTNFNSRKASELLQNPQASLCFHWDEMQKQVRIEGTTEEVSAQEADDYFATRRRESQIGAWASKQSSPLEHPEALKDRVARYTEQFKDKNHIPRPEYWSGFRLKPHRFEFWENGEFRLHQRTIYVREGDAWSIHTLYP